HRAAAIGTERAMSEWRRTMTNGRRKMTFTSAFSDRIRQIAFAAALATAATLTGAAQAQEAIKIAVGAPLTGPLAKQGQEVANAVQLAVDEWNAKGGVLGKQIELVEADDQGNPQVGVAAAEKV